MFSLKNLTVIQRRNGGITSSKLFLCLIIFPSKDVIISLTRISHEAFILFSNGKRIRNVLYLKRKLYWKIVNI